MNETNRRKFLEGTAGVAAGSRWAPAPSGRPPCSAQALAFKPEKGAKLRVLRWSRFVQGDIDAYMANVKKFTEKTGIEVRVDNEGWEDVRPKAAVAANTGAGPGHHPVDQRRRQPLPREAARRHRPVPPTWARSTAAGTRPAKPTCARRQAWIGVPLGAPAR
jgi:hypothetical protein